MHNILSKGGFMTTGNRLLDAQLKQNESIELLNSKIDKLEAAINKVVVNTTKAVI